MNNLKRNLKMKIINKEMKNIEKNRKDNNKCYLKAVKNSIKKYQYKELKEYLDHYNFYIIEGIVRKNKVSGNYIKELYWFKYTIKHHQRFISDSDDFSVIYIPITDKHFLKIYCEY